MPKVIDEWHIAGYAVLTLDSMEAEQGYNQYTIGGKPFEPVMLYDMPGCIAIVSSDTHIGQTVEFTKKAEV